MKDADYFFAIKAAWPGSTLSDKDMRSRRWPGENLFEDDLLPIYESKQQNKKKKKQPICKNEQKMHQMFDNLPSPVTPQPEL